MKDTRTKVHIQLDGSAAPLCNTKRLLPLATINITTTDELKTLLHNNPPTPVCKTCIACWTAHDDSPTTSKGGNLSY